MAKILACTRSPNRSLTDVRARLAIYTCDRTRGFIFEVGKIRCIGFEVFGDGAARSVRVSLECINFKGLKAPLAAFQQQRIHELWSGRVNSVCLKQRANHHGFGFAFRRVNAYEISFAKIHCEQFWVQWPRVLLRASLAASILIEAPKVHRPWKLSNANRWQRPRRRKLTKKAG